MRFLVSNQVPAISPYFVTKITILYHVTKITILDHITQITILDHVTITPMFYPLLSLISLPLVSMGSSTQHTVATKVERAYTPTAP